MRVLLWNIQSGGRDRAETIVAELCSLPDRPDIVVLNEFRAGASDEIAAALCAKGWNYSAFSRANPGYGGVAVFSTAPIEIQESLPPGMEAQGHRYTKVRVKDGALTLWSVYAPHRKEELAGFWSPLLEALASEVDGDVLLVGDLNAEPEHDPSKPLAGNSFVHQLTEEVGFRDLWVEQRPGDAAVEQSWHGRKNGYRIDHAFGSPSLSARVRACEYIHGPRERGASDHSMLAVRLTPAPLARKGSRRWLQIAVNTHRDVLDEAFREAAGIESDSIVEWLSPLESERYTEYRDGATLDRLDLNIPKEELKRFWPSGGPVWDGLARVGKTVFLLEAKAHIPEMLSGPSRAGDPSQEQITAALAATRKALTPRSSLDWNGVFYQYANRLAHLKFLRDHGIDARLVYVYFTNAPDVDSPSTKEEWLGAISLMECYFGVRRTPLSRYIHKLFVDARRLDAEVVRPVSS